MSQNGASKVYYGRNMVKTVRRALKLGPGTHIMMVPKERKREFEDFIDLYHRDFDLVWEGDGFILTARESKPRPRRRDRNQLVLPLINRNP